MPSSQPPSDDEGHGPSGRVGGRPTGFPGATGLKYTTTIMGPSRSGGMGLRVAGKRGHTPSGSGSSIRSALRNAKKLDTESKGDEPIIETIPPTPSSPKKPDSSAPATLTEKADDNASDSQPTPTLPGHDDSKSAPAGPRNIPIPFIPKFKGAAEMEARRRLRMQNRVPPGGPIPARTTRSAPANLNPEISSSSSSSGSESEEEKEDDPLAEDDDEFEDDAPEVDDSLDIIDADEFEYVSTYFHSMRF